VSIQQSPAAHSSGQPPDVLAPDVLALGAAAEVHEACVCLALHRATRAVSRRFDDVFRDLGLTNEQFSLLMAMHQHEPPTLSTVARLLTLDRTTLTANLKPLQRRDLVIVQQDPADRRVRRLALTPQGRSTIALAHARWREAHRALTDLLVHPDALREALAVLTDVAEADHGLLDAGSVPGPDQVSAAR